ncbi:hypothetical protein [Streptomyces sp. NPDC046759]|uniref:hypothetical protein n=1 Tax=Streptomyces sp. NPDC046759 TaxID=3155019 RepID=UPI0033FA8BEC
MRAFADRRPFRRRHTLPAGIPPALIASLPVHLFTDLVRAGPQQALPLPARYESG